MDPDIAADLAKYLLWFVIIQLLQSPLIVGHQSINQSIKLNRITLNE